MKVCAECKYHKAEYQVMQGPQGSQSMKQLACVHPENRDPIEGSPMPCLVCRQNEKFCGFDGKRYEPVPEQVKKQEGNIIDITGVKV